MAKESSTPGRPATVDECTTTATVTATRRPSTPCPCPRPQSTASCPGTASCVPPLSPPPIPVATVATTKW